MAPVNLCPEVNGRINVWVATLSDQHLEPVILHNRLTGAVHHPLFFFFVCMIYITLTRVSILSNALKHNGKGI